MELANQLAEFIKTQSAINDTVMNALMLAHDEIAYLKDAISQMTEQNEYEPNEEPETQIN